MNSYTILSLCVPIPKATGANEAEAGGNKAAHWQPEGRRAKLHTIIADAEPIRQKKQLDQVEKQTERGTETVRLGEKEMWRRRRQLLGVRWGLVLWRANWLHWLLQGWKTPKVWVCSKLIKPRASLSHWSLKASATLLTQHQVKCSCLNAAFNFPCCETLEGAFASPNAEFNRWPNRPWTNRRNRFS